MRKTVMLGLLLICLMTTSSPLFQQAKAQSPSNHITIELDGSLNPSTSPIIKTGTTYTLTNSVNGWISVEASNIILEGKGNTLTGGIWLDGLSNVTLENFNVNGGHHFGSYEVTGGLSAGIYLSNTCNSVVANNTITTVTDFVAAFSNYQTVAAVSVSDGYSNKIFGNNLVDNFQGMWFEQTTNNLIVENTISLSTAAESRQGYADTAGMYFYSSSNNSIYHNNFEISHDRWGHVVGEAKDSYYDAINIWDNGYPSGGNYWMNYQADEIDDSGIGDTPYVIDGPNENSSSLYNIDRYPLMAPFNSTFFALQVTPPKVSILSPTNQTYNNSSVPLVFSVDILSPVKSFNWTGYSLDGETNKTIANNSILSNFTIANLTNGLHSIVIYANDTYGNMGTSNAIKFTVAIPKTQPHPVTFVAAASVIVTILIVVVGLLVYLKKRKTFALGCSPDAVNSLGQSIR